MDLDGESSSEPMKNGTGIGIPTGSGDAPEAAFTAVHSKKRDAPPDMQEGTEKKKRRRRKKKKSRGAAAKSWPPPASLESSPPPASLEKNTDPSLSPQRNKGKS
jgi:hypothetical protein